MTWDRESLEEYDDGYTRESFERADEDKGDEMEDGERESMAAQQAAYWSGRAAAAFTYNNKLNELEIAPNGDDYNNLLDILRGGDATPHVRGR